MKRPEQRNTTAKAASQCPYKILKINLTLTEHRINLDCAKNNGAVEQLNSRATLKCGQNCDNWNEMEQNGTLTPGGVAVPEQ